MLEYPKALYQSIDDYRIVADKSAESKAGYKDFADLVGSTVEATKIPSLYGVEDANGNHDNPNLGSPS